RNRMYESLASTAFGPGEDEKWREGVLEEWAFRSPNTPVLQHSILYARRYTMKRSTERILVTHAGSLARPKDLMEMLLARNDGNDEIKADIENLKAALHGKQFEEAFLPAIAPGTMEHWMKNEYYPTEEAYLFAIADAMHEEYKAIVNAGFVLQIDDPDLADAWQMFPQMSVADYRKYQEMRIDALNHGLRDLPIDRVRFHMCWGSYHGP